MTDQPKQLDWDKFPAHLENPSDFRKGSGDYGVTFSVQVKHVGYIQPLMEKAQKPFAVFVVPVADLDQAEQVIKANDTPAQLSNFLPAPGDKMGPGICLVSVEILAQALGVDPRTVQLDADKWPQIRVGKGQYDAVAYCVVLRQAWKDAENNIGDEARKEKALIMREQRIRLQLRNAEHAGQLVSAPKMERAIEAVDAEDRNDLLNMPKKLGPDMDMVSGTQAEVKLNDWVRHYLARGAKYSRVRAIAGKAVAEATAAEQKKPAQPERKKKKKKK